MTNILQIVYVYRHIPVHIAQKFCHVSQIVVTEENVYKTHAFVQQGGMVTHVKIVSLIFAIYVVEL